MPLIQHRYVLALFAIDHYITLILLHITMNLIFGVYFRALIVISIYDTMLERVFAYNMQLFTCE